MKEPLTSREVFFRFYVSWLLRIFYLLLILLLGVYVYTLAGGSHFSLVDTKYLWISLGGIAFSFLMGMVHSYHDQTFEPEKTFSLLGDEAFKQWPEGELNLNVAEERLEGKFKHYPLVITPRIKTPVTHYLEIGLKIDPTLDQIDQLEKLKRPFELMIHEGSFQLNYRFKVPMTQSWNFTQEEIRKVCENLSEKIERVKTD